ncbi:MAG: SemiSWEET family transporter [Patescibacteria group bacterium]
MKSVISIAAIIITFLIIVFGIGEQILKNYRRKSTEGLSFLLFLLSFFGWSSWAVYGLVIRDPLMFVAQSAGALTTVIVLIQFFVYRKK